MILKLEHLQLILILRMVRNKDTQEETLIHILVQVGVVQVKVIRVVHLKTLLKVVKEQLHTVNLFMTMLKVVK